ncbi:MAG TPA: EAL domain-containing protein [Sulfuricella sp.]|nr:EAL domain-containing protein [Sulfuricella sp.]
MGRAQQVTPRRRSITRQAAARLIFSLGLFVVLVGVSTAMIYRAALNKATEERANDLASFYTSRISQLERDWELQSRDFRVRIEYTRILEEPHTALENLQAFMTIQGGNRRFAYLIIQDKQGTPVFSFGKDLGLTRIPLNGGSRSGWYRETSTGNLYRIFEEPIWLGKKGMGRMALFFPVDNALLYLLSSPGVTLTTLYQGKPTSSSLGVSGVKPASRGEPSSEFRMLSWTGGEKGPVSLLIQAPVKLLFSTAEMAVGVSVIPIFDGLILWFTLGTWLMKQARRVNALGDAVNEFSTDHAMTQSLRQRIQDAESNQADEIQEVAAALESLAEQTVLREQERAADEAHLRLWSEVFHNSGEAILISDHENHIVAVNHTFELTTGYSQKEVQGKNPRILSAGREKPDLYKDMWGKLLETGVWRGEVWDRRKDGTEFPKWLTITLVRNVQGGISHYIGSFTDISERKAEEQYIHFIAHHDALTSLPNRLMLNNFLGYAIEEAKRDDSQVGILFLDMDDFKKINDSLGHEVGDKLLIEVAHRLTRIVRGVDTVSRVGGDEFVVVCPGITQTLDIAHLATRIVECLSQVYLIDNHKLHSSPSIGISLFPGDGEDIPTLLKNADAAMYHAKAEGRGNFQFFTEAMNLAALERLTLENDLRSALEEDEFELYYQPQIEVSSGRVTGVEALLRWNHPEHGLIPPAKFIPVAEGTGLIVPLGEWVLRTACRQAVSWQQAGLPPICMAINISARQFKQENLFETIQKALAESHLEPCWLELEITETAAMSSPDTTVKLLNLLKEMGVKIAIDDFGTGYSSLAYLKLFAIDKLKIDQSFIRDIEHDVSDATLTSATIVFAKKLGLTVIAEGVETVGQFRFVAENGCDEVQGYYFSRPLPVAEITAYLRSPIIF